MVFIWLLEYIILGKVVSACGTVPGLDCSLSGCIVHVTSFLEHMVFVARVARRELDAACMFSSTLFSFVCKDAVMGPDSDPALVLESIEV